MIGPVKIDASALILKEAVNLNGRNAVSRVWARVLAAGAYMHLGRRLGYVLRNSGPQLGLFSHMIESLSMESSHRTSILGSEGHR